MEDGMTNIIITTIPMVKYNRHQVIKTSNSREQSSKILPMMKTTTTKGNMVLQMLMTMNPKKNKLDPKPINKKHYKLFHLILPICINILLRLLVE